MSLLYERNKFHTDLDITWSSLILNTIGAFCQQGIMHVLQGKSNLLHISLGAMGSPNLLCGRIVTIFIFLLSILIYQFYSASIVSNLLQKPQTNIRTVEEILLSPMRAGCEDILYNRDYFLVDMFKQLKVFRVTSDYFSTPLMKAQKNCIPKKSWEKKTPQTLSRLKRVCIKWSLVITLFTWN